MSCLPEIVDSDCLYPVVSLIFVPLLKFYFEYTGCIMPFCWPTSCLARSALRCLMQLWLRNKTDLERIHDGTEQRAASGTLLKEKHRLERPRSTLSRARTEAVSLQ